MSVLKGTPVSIASTWRVLPELRKTVMPTEEDRNDSRKGEERDHACGRAKREMWDDFEAVRPVRYWKDLWWQWDTGIWRQVSEKQIEIRVIGWAYEHCVKAPQKFWASVKGFFRGLVLIDDQTKMPSWTGLAGLSSGAQWALSCQDGILNLYQSLQGNREVISHTPDFFNGVKIPINVMEKAREPTVFLEFLDRIFEKNDEVIALVQEMMGYCLLAGNWKQTVFFLEGEGSNGKTTLLRILQEVLGEENCSKIPLADLGGRFHTCRTQHKLANFCPDEDESTKAIEGKMKAYVGGEAVYADVKHQAGVEFTPTAKIFVDHNRRLRFSDKSDGFWRRVRVIPFDYQIPANERDSRYVQVDEDWVFWEELSGIFWWMVEGLKRLRSQPNFTLPAKCLAAADDYRKENNPPGMFLDDTVEVCVGSTIDQSGLYRLFKEWADDSGFGKMSIVKFNREVRAWYKTLTKREITVVRPRLEGSQGTRQWVGLVLLYDPVVEAHDLLRKVKNDASD